MAQTKGQAVKASTKQNLLTHLRAYQQFCERYNLQYFPADNRQICRFGQYLVSERKFISADSIGNYQSGIRTCHHILGLQAPSTTEKQMQWFTQGIQRLLLHELKQAAPITPDILVRISRVVKYTDETEMVAWVATLVGFTMFLRKSNLVPDAMDKFDPETQFRRADLHVTNPFAAMMAEIRWSKTNQFRKRILRLPVLPTNNKAICPVLWTHYMINKVPAEPNDPAFTIHHNGQKTALSAYQLLARMRKWLTLISEEAEKFSLHSLRRGGRHSRIKAKLKKA